MELRNSIDGLKTLLEISSTPSRQVQTAPKEVSPDLQPLKGDSATLSNAGAEISQGASGSEIRPEKVASIQAAIAAGTYHVPASAVAGKVVDAMLSGPQLSEK